MRWSCLLRLLHDSQRYSGDVFSSVKIISHVRMNCVRLRDDASIHTSLEHCPPRWSLTGTDQTWKTARESRINCLLVFWSTPNSCTPTHLSRFLESTDKLNDIEKQTGYSKVYFFVFGVSTISAVIYGLGGAKLVTDLVSFVYPAYMSFKAIDSSNTVDHTQWLTYWVVFSFMSIIESIFGYLTEFIPFYFVIKVAFFIWLYHPKFTGAGLVYTQAIKPFVMPHLNALQKKSVAPAKKAE